MKNYRIIELPDCCGVCECFTNDKIGLLCVSDGKTKEYFITPSGLCDNFKRCGPQNAKSETQFCGAQNANQTPQNKEIK